MPNDTAEKQRAHRKRRMTLGQCYYCSSPAISVRFCERHLEKERIDSRIRYKRHIQQGKCTKCYSLLDEDADLGYTKCISCREHVLMPIKQFQRRRHNAIISD